MPIPNSTQYVNVVFPQPPAGFFTYSVPEKFRDILKPGCRVVVPLGRRAVTGFAVAFADKPDFTPIKAVADVLDAVPMVDEAMIGLAHWISDYYITPLGETLRTALPPGLLKKERLKISLAENPDWPEKYKAAEIALREAPWLYAEQLRKKSGLALHRHQLNRLAEQGLVELKTVLEETQARIKTEAVYHLARPVPPDELGAIQKRAPKQAYVLESLMGASFPLPRPDLDVAVTVLTRLESLGLVIREEQECHRNPYDASRVPPPKKVTLTDQQQAAFDTIRQANEAGTFEAFLLHGVTGSGKTQVYIESIRDAISRGQSALVLIPEIALTPQAVERYQGAFGDQVAVLHSRLSLGERYDAWRAIKEGRYNIALGPRSAIFAPLQNLGLIVVDEEHDGSYKQIDPAPRYHARDVAVMRAHLWGARVILGSATPSLESYFNAMSGKYHLLELTRRIDGVKMPEVHILDRSTIQPWDKDRVFDRRLVTEVGKRVDAGEQVILLQNRRGFSTFMRCQECGHIETCPHCDISLTFHQSDSWQRCHYCGYQKRVTESCSACGGENIQHGGVGTQRVEEMLKEHLPGVRTLRMDQDTTQSKGAHERIIKAFEKREADVLIGTQMVAKGHDFPHVHMVGIISADTGLHFPDFRAGERTFQLLTQTAGRAGRRERQGMVLVQTQSPDHPVLDFSKDHDYNAFYTYESEARRELGYPPWGRVAMIKIKGPDEGRVNQAANRIRQSMPQYRGIEILGPVPSPLARIQKQFRYQIILRSQRDSDPAGQLIRTAIREGLKRYNSLTAIPQIQVAIDVDPLDLL